MTCSFRHRSPQVRPSREPNRRVALNFIHSSPRVSMCSRYGGELRSPDRSKQSAKEIHTSQLLPHIQHVHRRPVRGERQTLTPQLHLKFSVTFF